MRLDFQANQEHQAFQVIQKHQALQANQEQEDS